MVAQGNDGGRRFPVKVAFRVDASLQIGSGHVMRCLTLADELERHGYECLFICRSHQGHLGELITAKGFGLHLLPTSNDAGSEGASGGGHNHAHWLGVSWQTDAQQTSEVLEGLSAEWLVIDHYALDARWEDMVAPRVGHVFVIDDLADRPHNCALMLDQNLGRLPSDYSRLVPESCLKLIGPGYALLRSEFAQLREKSLERRRTPDLKRILISLGGVDQFNVTGRVLSALASSSLLSHVYLDIIMGATAPHLEMVRQQVKGLPFKADVSVNVSDIAERMTLADLAVGAAGGTAWERCCLGVPSVLIALADNQVPGTRALEASGAAKAIYDPDQVAERLLPMVEDLCRQPEQLGMMAEIASGLTGGTGVSEISKMMVRFRECQK